MSEHPFDSDERFKDFVRQAARGYNPPPATPRDEMWARIQARRGQQARPQSWLRRPWRPRGRSAVLVAWGVGLAAMLVVGFGIGRFTTRLGDEPMADGAAEDRRAVNLLPYRVAAVRHLSQAEVLLTSFRSSNENGRVDVEVATWASQLLSKTRLLLDSPAKRDPTLLRLLEDLELVLVQLAHLDDGPNADEEAALASDAVHERNLLLRLRSVVPAGPVSAGI